MRGCVVLVLLLAACGHRAGGAAAPALPKGTAVRITDGGQIYDALNTTDCVKWPTAAVKKRAGQSGWNGFHPDAGLEGVVLASLPHCDHKTQVVLVAVGQYVVPVTATGVIKGGAGAAATAPAPAVAGGEPAAADELEGEEMGEGEEGGVVGGIVGGVVSSAYKAGDSVEIVDAGGVYDTINQTDCLTWPSDAVKAKAGSDAWGGYVPRDGEAGTVLAILTHCDSYTEILLLDVAGHVVPIGSVAVQPYSP